MKVYVVMIDGCMLDIWDTEEAARKSIKKRIDNGSIFAPHGIYDVLEKDVCSSFDLGEKYV